MDASAAFEEILRNLPRQHLRTRFRNHFGTPESEFGQGFFARGTVRAPLDRRLGHLLQEEPEALNAVLLRGPASELGVDRRRMAPSDPLGDILTEDRVLLVHGVTANLYAYLPVGEAEAWVRRVAVPKEERPATATKAPTLSRRQRAALAGKTKSTGKPKPSGRGKPPRKGPPRRRS